MKRLMTSSLAWFAVAAVLTLLDVVALRGTAAGIVGFAAMIAFIGACLRAAALTDDDELERTRRLTYGGMIGL